MGDWFVISSVHGSPIIEHRQQPRPASSHRPPRSTPRDLRALSLEDLLAGWDRAAFGITMRTIEILILRGDHARAIDVLRSHIRCKSPAIPSMQSPLSDVLPIRIANILEDAGYTTLTACHHATDAQLLQLDNLGQTSLELIRETVRCVESDRTPPHIDDLSDLEPDWPAPTVDAGFHFQTEGERTVSKIEEALRVLLDSGETAIDEIDAKIVKLTGEIDNLKRMRKLLAPGTPSKARTGPGKSDWAAMSQAIADVVRERGPLRAKAIAEIIGADYAHVGRITKQFPDLLTKNAEGEITLTDAA